MSQDNGLTLEEQATNFETVKHIQLVQSLLNRVVKALLDRGEKHDQSKLVHPEVGPFTELTKRLAGLTFGTPEYEANRKDPILKPALDHHYAHNRHHPQHFKNGIEDMNLIDVIEMLCDWKASSTRHNDGNLRKSIEYNANFFGISPQLVKIMENTVELLDS